MKRTRRFRGSWFLIATVATIALAEVVAWQVGKLYGFELSPLAVGFASVGLVAVITSFIYEGCDIG